MPPCPAEAPCSGQQPHSDTPPRGSSSTQTRPLWLSPQSRGRRGGPEREGAALPPWPGSHCGLRGGEVAPSGALAPCGSRGPSQGHISPAQGTVCGEVDPQADAPSSPQARTPFLSCFSQGEQRAPLGPDPSWLPPALSVLWEPQSGCGRTVTQGRGRGRVEPRPECSYEPGFPPLTSDQRRRYGRSRRVCSATAVFTGFALQPGQGGRGPGGGASGACPLRSAHTEGPPRGGPHAVCSGPPVVGSAKLIWHRATRVTGPCLKARSRCLSSGFSLIVCTAGNSPGPGARELSGKECRSTRHRGSGPRAATPPPVALELGAGVADLRAYPHATSPSGCRWGN